MSEYSTKYVVHKSIEFTGKILKFIFRAPKHYFYSGWKCTAFLFPLWSQKILSIWYCVCPFTHYWVSKESVPPHPVSSPHAWEQKGNIGGLWYSHFPSPATNHFLEWSNSVSGGGKMEQANEYGSESILETK